jgi:hypothetical protein
MHHAPRGLLSLGTPMTLQQRVQLPQDLPSNGLVGPGILSMKVAELRCQMRAQVEVVGKVGSNQDSKRSRVRRSNPGL